MAGADTNGFDTAARRPRAGRSDRPALDRGAVERLFSQSMPHSIEAEMALLGSLLLDPTVTADIITLIPNSSPFYSEQHAAIFDGLLSLYERHQQGDLLQLMDVLRDRGALEQVGGSEYLVSLAEQVPSAANAPHYAQIVAEKYRLRRLIDAAGETIYEAFHHAENGPEGARGVLDAAERRIFEIAEQSDPSDAAALGDLLQKTIDMLEESEGRSITGLSTGFYDLDHLTGGLQPGELIILAARPSMGKTALALNLAEQIAFRGRHPQDKAPVLLFSMEMSKQAVSQRFLSAYSGVDSHLMRSNRLGGEHYKRLIEAAGGLSEAPLYVDDTPVLSVMQLRARARRLKARHDISCVIVDYLQLMSAPASARESRQVEVSAISRGIKALARELSVPVVCLSQLNRAAESREGHRPRMSDLRESGSIEQDADVIMLLHREEYFHIGDDQWFQDNPESVGLAELIIAKQRNGPTGMVKLTWNADTTRFYNHTDASPPKSHEVRQERAPAPRPSSGGQAASGAHGAAGAAAIESRPFTPARDQAPTLERRPTGPVADFRDGGGPDPADTEDAPFEDDTGGLPF